MSNIIKKLLYTSIILVLVLSTGFNTVTAQGPAPEKPERLSKAGISLAGVESYYGLLSQRSGSIKVIVELADTAGIEYQASLNSSGLKAVNQTKAQINRIEQAQTSFLQAAQAAGIETTEIYRV